MPGLKPVAATFAPAIVPALRPTEYTAALLRALQAVDARSAAVLDVGCGSGVILAALGAMGAASLCGVDIEAVAVDASATLLNAAGFGAIAELHRGDMWEPVAGRRFDLVAANLPHFPLERGVLRDRLPSWSNGGRDGRHLLDPFIEGLAAHLAPAGRALITHNGFVGVGRSRALAARHGLTFAVVATTMIHIPAEKLERLTVAVLRAEEGRTIHRHGPYAFAEMHIAELRHAEPPA